MQTLCSFTHTVSLTSHGTLKLDIGGLVLYKRKPDLDQMLWSESHRYRGKVGGLSTL